MHDPRESTRRLADLLRREHAALADFLVALADFDHQRHWLQLGYPNLFEFLRRELGLSRGAAHYRKVAARLVQRFPEIVEPLRDGRLCFSSVLELAKVLTEANRAEAIPRFFHCSKQEAKAVAVEILPAAVIPRREVVTSLALPAPRAAAPEVHPDEPAARPIDATTNKGRDGSPDAGAQPPARHRLEGVPRQARPGPHRPVARPARRLARAGAGGGARPAARAAGPAARRGEEAANEPTARAPRARDRRDEAGGLVPRRGKMPVADHRRRYMRLHDPPGSGPRRAARTRRAIDSRELQADLPLPQRPRGAAVLRRRVDGSLHRKARGGRPDAFHGG